MVSYTKEAIVKQFVTLLNEKPLKHITVTKIIKDLGLSRNTFYYHFRDIFSLVEYWFKEEYLRVKHQIDSAETLQEGYIHAMEIFKDNKKALKHLYESGKEAPLTHYLSIAVDAAIGRYMDKYFLEKHLHSLEISKEDFSFLARYHKYAIIGFIIEWLNSDTDEKMESLMEQMSRLSTESILLYLNRIEHPDDHKVP